MRNIIVIGEVVRTHVINTEAKYVLFVKSMTVLSQSKGKLTSRISAFRKQFAGT